MQSQPFGSLVYPTAHLRAVQTHWLLSASSSPQHGLSPQFTGFGIQLQAFGSLIYPSAHLIAMHVHWLLLASQLQQGPKQSAGVGLLPA